MSYRRFCQRLKQGRIGTAPMTKRRDLCPICHDWESQVVKVLTASLQDMRRLVESECPRAMQ
eukprot:6489124-Alexandrium_andersonii.AAC.1